MIMPPKVKICCISSVEEAQIAIRHGADFIGLVSEMPSGPGVIPDEKIEHIISHVKNQPVKTVLLTSKVDVNKIISQQKELKPSAIQLVNHLLPKTLMLLKKNLPETILIQVIHVENEKSIAYALEISPFVDFLLLDSGMPANGILGGTGNVHDWKLSKKIIEHSEKPVFLAGGLKPDNVKEAIQLTNAFGVDVCSGVRTDGTLDKKN